MQRLNRHGFTIPELLVVIVVLGVMLAGVIWLLRGKSYVQAERDAEHRLGVAQIAQGLVRYKAAHGNQLPPGIPTEVTPIATLGGSYDACAVLVPDYMKNMPYDTLAGSAYIGTEDSPELTDKPCNEPGVRYISGYTIQRKKDNSVVVGAGAGAGAVTFTVRQ